MEFFAAHPHYAWVFLICMAIFPRLTMLFAVATPFGVLHWLGWFFCPASHGRDYGDVYVLAYEPGALAGTSGESAAARKAA